MSTNEFEPVLLALPSLAPALALEVLPHGLTFHKLFVQADGRTHDILIGPEDPHDHAEFKYTNCLIGRYTNRLPVGSSTLTHKATGTTSQLTILQNDPGANPRASLHGGPAGLDLSTFAPLSLDGSDITLFSTAEQAAARKLPSAQIFGATSPAGDQGYPGTLRVEVLVALLDGPAAPAAATAGPGTEYTLGSVLILYRAGLEEQDVVTPVNLTQHWGFNLDASLNARRAKSGAEPTAEAYPGPNDSVKAHLLRVDADKNVALDADALATGKLEDVVGGRDFRGGKPIGEGYPAKGYDEFWAFEKPMKDGKAVLTRKEMEEGDLVTPLVGRPEALGASPVSLAAAKSGLKLEFWTNQAGVQFWSANPYDRSNARKKIHGGTGVKHTGDGYGGGAGAFLEFHEPLAAWMHPELVRNGNDTLLGPGEVQHNWTRMDVRFTSGPEEATA